ncbi:MAG TPA: hypothetical protein VNO30_01295 [Kofleriaceae bacterium]|nr:hypothetical protein [Kofleriaceae bacterium]
MGLSYERKKELLASIEGPLSAPPAEQSILMQSIVDWNAKRAEHLDALLDILTEDTKEPRIDKWKSRVSALKDALSVFCKTDTRLPQPATAASLALVLTNAISEADLVEAVEAALPAVEARDAVTRYIDAVREETKTLETSWASVIASHKSYEAQELAVIEQVERMLTEVARDIGSLQSDLKKLATASIQTASAVVSKMPEGGANEADIPADNEIQVADQIIDRWQLLKTGMDTEEYRFQTYFREELGGPLLVFQDFREETKKFIDEYGYSKLLEQVEKAKAALDPIRSSGTTPANLKDGEAFVTAAKLILQLHATNAKKIWDDFATKHEGKFFGPIKPDISKALLDRDEFEKKYERLQAHNLHSLLQMWRDSSREPFGIDFSGLPAHVADQYKAAIRPALERVDEVLKQPVLDRFGANFKVALQNAFNKSST